MPEEPLATLPVDIPWKRLCVTEDMIDTEACLGRLTANPSKWKPSIAVFGYEPPTDQQPYDDMIVSYLKVTCTITGHQSSKDELGYLGLYNYWYDPAVDDFVIQLGAEYDYWACYGALLQVSVTPADKTQRENLANYPYFVDFQPKKRELYELVTQTGTSMSRSLEEVRVQKGFTTATNSEVLDNDKGIDWSTIGAVGGGIAGGAATGGSPLGVVVGSAIGSELGGLLGGGGDSGKAVNQAQETNIRTTDSATEKREDFSHTTQLTQMYHQLTSYHLGTNRALFYILPRPHIVQTERTFVNGPRVLEGIQEFMLVVMRPKSVADICVNAYLETAHIYYEKGAITTTALYTFEDTPAPVYFNSLTTPPNIKFTGQYTPLPGYEFDLSLTGEGYEIASSTPGNVTTNITVSEKDNRADISITIPPSNIIPVGGFAAQAQYPHTQVIIKFKLRKTGAPVEDIPKRLYIISREVCCCDVPTYRVPNGSLVYETPLMVAAGTQLGDAMSIAQANQVGASIGHHLVQSLHDPSRYPHGMVSFAEAQFLADRITQHIAAPDHPDNQSARDIEGLKADVRRKLLRAAPSLRRADLLHMPLVELRDRFGLSSEEAAHVRRAAMRLEEPERAPEERWDARGRQTATVVPEIAGQPVHLAQQMLFDAHLHTGEITYHDSIQPSDTILEQTPASGEKVPVGTAVNLMLSTGASVFVPDVVGKPLSEALCMLRDAGLRTEPRLRFVSSPDSESSAVLDIQPAVRSYVTPNSEVTLRVARQR